MLKTGRKVVFLDRDGVINRRPREHEYVTRVENFIFNLGIFNVLQNFSRQGYNLIVITNQRGVARGLLSEGVLHEIHRYMSEELSKREVEILDIFYCPHEKDSCNCRKPKPGLLEQATAKYSIDVSNSILISDDPKDVQMGRDFKIGKNVLIPLNKPEYYEKN